MWCEAFDSSALAPSTPSISLGFFIFTTSISPIFAFTPYVGTSLHGEVWWSNVGLNIYLQFHEFLPL
jgi:hypothetical protein